jgi:deazaflavin-dependent oxidoreductase (nitroreductase family)
MTETTPLPPLPPLAPSAPRAPAFARFHLWLYRVSGGRLATRIPGRRFLMLTTTGRKSGARYAIPLEYHTDGQTPYVIGSNYGKGYPPAWYLNLLANPTVEVEREGRRQWATASLVDAADRARIWASLVRVSPYYARYQRNISREIPLVLLRRVE